MLLPPLYKQQIEAVLQKVHNTSLIVRDNELLEFSNECRMTDSLATVITITNHQLYVLLVASSYWAWRRNFQRTKLPMNIMDTDA